MWGFAPVVMKEFWRYFEIFLQDNGRDEKAEFYLPDAVVSLVREGVSRCKVYKTSEQWFGVTYPKDRTGVAKRLRNAVKNGAYPSPLW